MKQFIYADNAATTKLDPDAFEAMKPYLLEEYGNPSQPYFFGKKAQRAIKEARKTIAKCINAESEQILFTSGGTESDNWAIKCFGAAPSDVRVLVTSPIEHHAVLNSIKDLHSLEAHYLHVDSQGLVDPSGIAPALGFSDRPIPSCLSFLVSVMFANNEIGTIQPIKELAEAAHKKGAPFHTDAVQAVGHIPIDVQDLNVDLLSASAHKFNGPKGIGFLYDKGRHLFAHNSGGSQEFGRRAGTENVAAIVGMAVALKKNCDSMMETQKKLSLLEARLIDHLSGKGLDFIRNGGDNHLPGLISLSFKGCDGEMLLHRLDLMGICVSTGAACDTKNTQISHVLKAIKLDEEYAKGTIRISLGKDNTADDCDKIADGIIKILGRSGA